MTLLLLHLQVKKSERMGTTTTTTTTTTTNEQSGMCVLCYTERANIILLPCKHECLCKSCLDNWNPDTKSCPLCRCQVQETMMVYLS